MELIPRKKKTIFVLFAVFRKENIFIVFNYVVGALLCLLEINSKKVLKNDEFSQLLYSYSLNNEIVANKNLVVSLFENFSQKLFVTSLHTYNIQSGSISSKI
jgi:hypothetical protein